MSAVITKVYAIEVLDSRGNPTIETTLFALDGHSASGISPSGASTGIHEAHELRDGDVHRYFGKGVQKAIANVAGEISKAIVGKSALNPKSIDEVLINLDGTANKHKLGANAILSVSIAAHKLAAKLSGMQLFEYLGGKKLPIPLMNIINGGAHASNDLAIQEFMIVPFGFETFAEKLRAGTEVFHTLKSIIKKAGYSTAVGDEGGFAPGFGKSNEALSSIVDAIEKAGYKAGTEISIALDSAASEFYKNGVYTVDGSEFSSTELALYYKNLVEQYPIISIEDPFSEGDIDGFANFMQICGKTVQVVGDDVFCTNPKLIEIGIQKKLANALLVKPNQIGTITETIAAINMARNAGFKNIMSHRSGETEDVTISHLAVGFECEQIKTGAPCRVDRTAKYNELLRIEARLKNI